MAMTPDQMKEMIRSICEEVVSESLGNAIAQLETLFNNSLAAYAQTITAGKIAGELDEQIGRAYENMVLMEAQRISNQRSENEAAEYFQWLVDQQVPRSAEEEDEPTEPNPFDEEPGIIPEPPYPPAAGYPEPKVKTKLKAVEDDDAIGG